MHLVSSSSSGPRNLHHSAIHRKGNEGRESVRNYIFIFVFLFRHSSFSYKVPPTRKGRQARQTENLCTKRNFAKRTTLIIVVRLITFPEGTEREGTHIFHAEGFSLLQEPLLLCRLPKMEELLKGGEGGGEKRPRVAGN